jgi:hypothetical protein
VPRKRAAHVPEPNHTNRFFVVLLCHLRAAL